MSPAIDPRTASALIDLDAFVTNIETLRAHVAPAAVMVVVKADAYGHGMIECARVAREAGADWLGVATPEEALAVREAGDRGRLLAWLYGPDTDLTPVVDADVDLSAQSAEQIARIVLAAGIAERRARVHLKIDTGLSRNGATAGDWPAVCRAARHAEQIGGLEVVGIWSHLAAADEPGASSIHDQQTAYEAAYGVALGAGLTPSMRHLSNSAGALLLPQARYDLVRIGIAAYGIDPDPGIAALAGVTLRPVMRLRAQLCNVKIVDAGAGVSYGHTWHASAPTTLGLVPLGYGDGIPRHAGNTAEVSWLGGRAGVRGRICMDQFMIELGAADTRAQVGQEVTLFGPGDHGEPTAADWAGWCGTIGYEIVTRIGARVPRIYHRGEGRDRG
ncbi:MAG TPA: alanine racemase [Nakamurella sp.]